MLEAERWRNLRGYSGDSWCGDGCHNLGRHVCSPLARVRSRWWCTGVYACSPLVADGKVILFLSGYVCVRARAWLLVAVRKGFPATCEREQHLKSYGITAL